MERKAYELIKKHGRKGIYQNDLWRTLGINSREASRIVAKLLKKNLITRKPGVNRGRKTYLLIVIPESRRKKIIRRREIPKPRIDIRPFLDIPCVKCPYINKCYTGGFYDPTRCTWMEEWLDEQTRALE
ncbi:MAG: AsnC family transcriptional regulator [Desulfurococcales archaeon]|nr:AsnC family transcriptional regulator [Desulfurococcales archaeon]